MKIEFLHALIFLIINRTFYKINFWSYIIRYYNKYKTFLRDVYLKIIVLLYFLLIFYFELRRFFDGGETI